MKTSIDGMLAILKSEAVVLSTYDDGGGVLTIGVGHTAAAGQPVPQRGLKLTLRQALQLFIQDLAKFERGVLRALDKVTLRQHEFDGFVSFHFNTGQMEKGTVDDKWERGDKAGAMKTLLAYKKDNGKVIKGLEVRRLEEKAIIMRGEYPRVQSILVADGWRSGRAIKPRQVPADEIKAVLRELLAGVPAKNEVDVVARVPDPPAVEAKPPAPGGAAEAAGGVVGGAVAGGVAAANGLPWTWIALIGGVIAALLFISLLVAKGKNHA